MNKYPLVSVLITVYNREKYISAAIESVLNSTLIDFELIVVDDCSKDNSYLIAKEYGSIDSRVTVYQNEVNLGDYNNRNKAAGYAVGKYLKYVDADDLIYPHGLDVMVSAMESFPDSVLGTQSNLRQDDLPYPFSINPQESFLSHFLYGGTFLSGPTGVIIRRDIFNEVGGFSGARYVGDTELWLKLASRYNVVKFQPSLIWWRSHDDQEIKKEQMSFEPALIRYRLDKSFLEADNCPLSINERNLAIKKLNRRFIVNSMRQLVFKNEKKMTILLFKRARVSVFDFLQAIFH
jgi:glycosyltransferase involved in cell wall biosynthesis